MIRQDAPEGKSGGLLFDALEQAGGNVRFTVLEGHDHDVWTDTCSGLQFYDWLPPSSRTL